MSVGFTDWLQDRLKGCECDVGVLVPYVVSILEEEEDETELEESLESILSSMIDPSADLTLSSSEILSKWRLLVVKEEAEGGTPSKGPLDLTAAMSEIAESKSSAYRNSIKKGPSNTDAAVKAAILAGYSQEEEEDLEGAAEDDREEDEMLLCRNTNAESVAKSDLQTREKARASAAAKKDKDKEDREGQKKSQEDRKKKAQEKAAKGERRR